MSPVSRDLSIGVLFAAAVTAFSVGLIQFFNFYQFAGLNQSSAIVMMSLGAAAGITSTILTLYFCHKKSVSQ